MAYTSQFYRDIRDYFFLKNRDKPVCKLVCRGISAIWHRNPGCAFGGMKVRDVIKLVQNDGWRLVRMKGDHRHYCHPGKRGIVTIAGHARDDLKAGTLNSILKQAGLK